MLDTSNPYNYKYQTKALAIHILGGIKTNKLESLRVTLSVQKLKAENILRQSIDLYNDNLVEKLVRKCAERLEIGTGVIVHWLKQYNLRKVQYLAGHRYISSTERYQQDDLESLHKTINTYHPFS